MPTLQQWLAKEWRDLRDRVWSDLIEARYRRVYDRLSTADLMREDPTPQEEDLASLFGPPEARVDRFLGLYSEEGGRLALERYGFLEMLRKKGFENLLLSRDLSDSSRQVLRIHYDQRDPDHLLVEMVLGFRSLELPDGTTGKMLSVEWLVMQDPRREFSPDRPPLPEQAHPGLGLFRWQGELLRLMATRLGCDGLMNNPQQFHNGALYGRVMKFADPVDEGLLRALERDLADLTLREASEAVSSGRVRGANGEVFEWEGRPQVLPITLPMQAYFKSEEYRLTVDRVRDEARFTVEA